VPEEDTRDIGYNKIVYNVIETVINSFLGKEVENSHHISVIDPIDLKKYPLYLEYYEGTKNKFKIKE
jgi:hypothetical protein